MKNRIAKAREKVMEAEDLLSEAESILGDHPMAEQVRHRRDDMFELVEELSPEDGV